jgi:dTDP-4-amino-4,6-dideoxygalactose transaminase
MQPPQQPGRQRMYLSAPHMSGGEQAFVQNAFETNWIAPTGPHVEAFERELAEMVGLQHAAAVSSGTAAIHLALLLCGVRQGDEVLVSTLTFSASVNPVCYVGARPIFIDSEPLSWNLDVALLEQVLRTRRQAGKRTAAVIVVHLYGQSADLEPLVRVCAEHDVPLIEDAAECLGASYHGRQPGTFGHAGVYSFNGNKIITTGGGGMLVSDDGELIAHARKLASQARDPAPHYEHSEVGYNYRLSNVLAAIGRAQLHVLEDRVQTRRRHFETYREALSDLPGVTFQPEAAWGRHTRWLTCLLIDPAAFGATREDVRLALEAENIESRPLWKPMHLQPVFTGCEVAGGAVAERLFDQGLCLPSGSALTANDLARVIEGVRRVHDTRVSRTDRVGAGAPR